MISVVIPAYNAELFIRDAVQSILNQTIQQLEVIVVDDGSSDRTIAIVSEMMRDDDRIRLIRNLHGGVSCARNAGIEAARYEWIANMDADDLSVPHRLETLLNAAQAQPEVSVWGSYLLQTDKDGNPRNPIRKGVTTIDEFNRLDRTRELIDLYNTAAFYRREHALEIGGFDPVFDSLEDADFCDRMAARFGAVLIVPEELILYRLHGNNISHGMFFKQRIMMDFIKERNRRQQAGEPAIPLDEYIARLNLRPLSQRIASQLYHQSQLYYRLASLAKMNRRYGHVVRYTALSVLLNPFWAIKRGVYLLTHQRSVNADWQGV